MRSWIRVAAILTAVFLLTSSQGPLDVASSVTSPAVPESGPSKAGTQVPAGTDQSLITNGTFDRDTSGWRSVADPNTSGWVDWSPSAGRSGGGALHLIAAPSRSRPFVSWTCTFDSLPIGRRMRVSAWVKCARCEDAPVATVTITGAAGNLAVASSGGVFTRTGGFDWARIEVLVPVPEGGQSAYLSLFLRSGGEAWIDDVQAVAAGSLTDAEHGAEPIEKGPGLLRVHSAWEYSLRASATSQAAARAGPQVLIALPLDYREQVPLAFELTTRPARRVQAARVYEERPGAWIARVELAPLGPEEKVVLDWTAVVLVGPRSFRDFPKRASFPTEWPPEARPWLAATRCAQADDPRIRRIAVGLRDSSQDVRRTVENTLVWLLNHTPEGRDLCSVFDAVQALDHVGSCVSSANLAAALLRANGIPARILGGYPSWASGPMQCHFIVEAFVPGYGWFPLEPTRGRAPVRPSDQVQVSIVPPQYEDQRAVDRKSGVPGLLYLSIRETLGDARAFWGFGALDRERGAAVAVTQPQLYAHDAAEWEQAFTAARVRRSAWLAQKPSLDADGALRTPLAADSLLAARSPTALVSRLSAP